MIRQSIEAGMVGGSIEDQSLTTESGLVPIDLAAEKILAAREAADASGIVYTITARAESFYANLSDPLGEAIARANRYVEAGADCIFIPGLSDLADIRVAVQSVGAPLSVGIGSGGAALRLEDLAEVGVRRVSTGGALPRAIYAFVQSVSSEMLAGSFESVVSAIPETKINEMLRRAERALSSQPKPPIERL